MRVASLYDCFERHLMDLSLGSETHEIFVATVVEKYLINMGSLGFSFGSHAEDTFIELCDNVAEMLQKKIYGHVSLDNYRQHLRNQAAA